MLIDDIHLRLLSDGRWLDCGPRFFRQYESRVRGVFGRAVQVVDLLDRSQPVDVPDQTIEERFPREIHDAHARGAARELTPTLSWPKEPY